MKPVAFPQKELLLGDVSWRLPFARPVTARRTARKAGAIALAGLLLTLARSAIASPPNSNYRLVFADEFNGTSVNTTKWIIASPSWAIPSVSASTATASAVSVANGVLTLSATRPTTAAAFNSGSISSYQIFSPTNGYFEASIQLPTTPGSWPAFWGLYTGWPPETDIMEYPITTDSGTDGLQNYQYNTNFHYSDSTGAAVAGAGPVTTGQNLGTTGYHTFGVNWTAGASVVFYLDNSQSQIFTGSAVGQMVNMYMMLDYAVGGWPGTPSLTQWPAGWTDTTKVDWVRVWQLNPNGDTTSNWKLAGNGSFTTSANWANGIVPSFGNQTAYFGKVSATSASVTMPDWKVFGNVTFDGTSGSSTAYTIGTSSAQLIQLASTAGSTVQATAACTASQNVGANVELWSDTTFENDMTGGLALNLNGGVSGNGNLTVTGAGPTVINSTNVNTGTLSIGLSQEAALLQVTVNNALGSGSLVIGPGGNTSTASLQLTGGATQPNNIGLAGRNNTSGGIENVSGNNTLAGIITANMGGGMYGIQSDAGLLTLSGELAAGATGARALTLQGAGNGVVSGSIQNGTGTVSLTKAGGGTWTLEGSNTFGGSTTVSGGTLCVAAVTPVAQYSFDNVSGSTVINTGSGGAAMNGTLTGGAAVVSGGRFGNAVSLSGGAYVSINNPIETLSNTSAWTVSAWVHTTTAGATLLSKSSGGWASGNSVFYLGDGSAGGSGGIPSAVRYGGGFYQGSTGATAVNDGKWHMVTYVNNGGGGYYSIYVDGAIQPLAIGNSGFTNVDAGSLVRLGATTDSAAGDGTVNFSGLMDEVEFYAQALSAGQVAVLYQGQTPVSSLPAASAVAISSGAVLQVSGVTQTLNPVSGAGSLLVTGSGALTLAGPANFTGSTMLTSGSLTVNGGLGAGGTLTTAANTVLAGRGAVNATATINGIHLPGTPPVNETFGTLAYGSTARLEWPLTANSTASGFNNITASGPVSMAGGAIVDVILNGTGSTVALTNAFWTQPQSWTVLTGASLNGSFGLGTVSVDPAGLQISSYGVLSLQQTSTAVKLVFTPYTVQQLWQRQFFGTNWNNAAVAGNLADPANDGVSNLVKFALGLDPTVSDAMPWTSGHAGLPVQGVATVAGTTYLSLQVRRPVGLTGITYAGLVSGDLVNWTNAAQQTPVSNGDGSETVTFLDTVPMNSSIERFIHLQISQP